MRRGSNLGLVLSACAVLAIVGCGSGLVEVTGTVTLDGRPVKMLEIEFDPVDPSIGTTAVGYTKEDGSFRLHYPGEKTGAPPGEYTVRIKGAEVDGETGQRTRVPARYNSQTELKVQVQSGMDPLEFALESK